MKCEVIWAPSAQSDLALIVRYGLDHNPGAADRVADRIEAAASSLGDMATGRRGRMANTFEKVVPGLPYVIVYEIDAGPVLDAAFRSCVSSTVRGIGLPISGHRPEPGITGLAAHG